MSNALQKQPNQPPFLKWLVSKQLHIVIWMIFIFYEVIIAGLISGHFGKVPAYIFYYTLNISLFYVHAHVVLRIAFKDYKSIWKLPPLLLLELVVYFLISFCLDYIIINYVGYNGPKFKMFSLNHLAGPLYRSIYFMIFSSGYFFLMNYLKERRKTDELQSQRLNNKIQMARSENAFLKAQIQPHLLFNTLDFIYQNAREASPVAAEAILSLSEMMRYSVDSNQDKDFVLVGDEITQVENLINLHQLRKNHSLQIHLHYENDVKTAKIIPLVLITLVENMFKHGDLTHFNHPAEIKIMLKGDDLWIDTINLISASPNEKGLKSGLENIRKRLSYAYPKHDFVFGPGEDGYFRTSVKIFNSQKQ